MGRASRELSFHVLGPLIVTADGERIDLGAPRQRAVLALLAMAPNEVVSVDRLIDRLWQTAPASAQGTLQAYVSNLRKALEPERDARTPPRVLVTEAPGYRLCVDRARLDSARYEDLLAEARRGAGDGAWVDVVARLDEARSVWRGIPLADFEHEEFTQVWRSRFDELRAAAEELRVDALLQLGRSDEAVADLETLIDRWPLRERLRTLQLLALAATGRQADALRAYDRARQMLVDELGIDPGPELEDAYRRVLQQDPSLVGAASTRRAAPSQLDLVASAKSEAPEADRDPLVTAAALGEVFRVGTLAVALGLDVLTLAGMLEPALRQRLLVDEGGGSMRFSPRERHDQLLADTGPLHTGTIHARIAEALAAAQPTHPFITCAEIADQFDRAANLLGPAYARSAADAAAAAAQEATGACAFADAAHWWEAAWRHGRHAGMPASEEVAVLTEIAIAHLDAGLRPGPAGATEAQHRAIGIAVTLPPEQRAGALARATTIAFERVRLWQWRQPGERDAVVTDGLRTALTDTGSTTGGDGVERRIRLLACLAVEQIALPDGPTLAYGPSAEAVELARRHGNVELLARALLARSLALDAPGRRAEQRAALDELIGRRDDGVPPVALAAALAWRSGHRLALAEGPIGDDQDSVDLEALTGRLHDPVLSLTGDWARAAAAFCRADFAGAEARAASAFARHRAFGDWEAPALLVAHEFLRRRELALVPAQPIELLPADVTPGQLRWLDVADLCWSAYHRRIDSAAELVEQNAPRVLEWRGSAWTTWMAHLVEAAVVSGSRWTSRLYEALAPFAGEIIVRWPHPVLGAVDHYLGLGARALDRPDLALGHFERAKLVHDLVGARPWALRSAVEGAHALADVDPDAARDELDALDPELDVLGLVDLRNRSAALRRDISGEGRPSPSSPA